MMTGKFFEDITTQIYKWVNIFKSLSLEKREPVHRVYIAWGRQD